MPILVDTNLIIHAHKTGCWRKLSGAYRLETVRKCVEETQTGFWNRALANRIVEAELKARVRVHDVSEKQQRIIVLKGGGGLHEGERHLWAHLVEREKPWRMCGPDGASLRFGCELGHKHELVSMEKLLIEINEKPPKNMEYHYGEGWHCDMTLSHTLQTI